MGSAAALRVLLFMAALAAVRADGGGGPVHHVAGDDRGWAQSSDISSWASGRVFRPGDDIWFTYSTAVESVVELGSREEFESCDLRNPLRLYTDGLDAVHLDGEGSRFFTSGRSESCKNGLKLHVDVVPHENHDSIVSAIAPGPSSSADMNLKTISVLPWLVVAAILVQVQLLAYC